MKIKVSVKSGGGEDPPPLTPQQRQEWNNYVDWVEKKGYKGSPLLDKKDTGLANNLFNQYKKENPTVTLSLDHVKSVQNEMQNLASAVQSFEARRNNPNAQNIMAGTSKVDGWPGSKTTSFKFPGMTKEETTNGVLTSKTNFGILDPRLKPTDSVTARASALANAPTTPNGVKLEKMSDGRFYFQNRDGDWILYNK